MVRWKLFSCGLLLTATTVSAAWAWGVFRPQQETTRPEATLPEEAAPDPLGQTVRIAGGTFRMGNSLYADQQPVHEVAMQPFEMDRHEVTNGQFARFVTATGYLTTAEQQGWSHVYDVDRRAWQQCEGANWRHPSGAHSSIDGRSDYPVVHVSWFDATAYADWAGKRLPTEAQWEYAARSGLRDAAYPWGREELVEGRYQANCWQHGAALAADGHLGPAPVRSFPPSGYGLYDMSGNVWEWCDDWYDPQYYRSCPSENPPGPPEGTLRVQRGGSWLSPEDFCLGHHVSTRGRRGPEETWQHVGFRCVGVVR